MSPRLHYYFVKRKLYIVYWLPLLLLAAGASMGFRSIGRAAVKPARTEQVKRGVVEIKVTETGAIEPLRKVEVKSKVAGRLERLLVQEGSRVRAGQVLGEIDPTEINSQVDQMRAQLLGARARYEQAVRGAAYQKAQTSAGIRQARETLRSAEARLRSVEEENRIQPRLTRSDISQATASLQSAKDSLALLQTTTHPQALIEAQTGFTDAEANLETVRRRHERQQQLLSKGFIARQAVEQSESELASARARRDQARKRLDLITEQQRLEIADARNRVDQAAAALERANANRSVVLIKSQDVRAARASVEQARAGYSAASSGSQQDRMRENAIEEAQAAVTQIQNQLNEVMVRQGDTRLLASMSGVVTKRYIEQGELITSGTSAFSNGTPIVQVADLSQMLIKMTVNEVDVNRIHPGLPVEITVDGVKNRKFQGAVRKVSPAAISVENQGGGGSVVRFAVEVLVDRPDERLKPGMSAKCTIIIDRKRNVLRLPNDCVKGEGKKAKVEAVEGKVEKGKPVKFKPRPVVAGLRGDSHVEIVSGLRVNDRVKPGIYTGPKRRALDMFH